MSSLTVKVLGTNNTGVTLPVGQFHALDPRIDLALTEPQLRADTEAARSATLAPQVVNRLHGNFQLRGELSQRHVVPVSRL